MYHLVRLLQDLCSLWMWCFFQADWHLESSSRWCERTNKRSPFVALTVSRCSESSGWFQKEASDSAQMYAGSVSGGTAVWQPLQQILAPNWTLSENREHISLTHSAMPFLALLASSFIQRTYGRRISRMDVVAASLVTGSLVTMHPVKAFPWGMWRVRFLHSSSERFCWLTYEV